MFYLGKPGLRIQFTWRKAEPRRDKKTQGKRGREKKERE